MLDEFALRRTAVLPPVRPAPPTDLERLTALLDSFGARYEATKERRWAGGGFLDFEGTYLEIDGQGRTLPGYAGFVQVWEFDADGKFVGLGARE